MPWRIAAFYLAGQLASALSDLLAYSISFKMDWAISRDGDGSSSLKHCLRLSYPESLSSDFRTTHKQHLSWTLKNGLSSSGDFLIRHRLERGG